MAVGSYLNLNIPQSLINESTALYLAEQKVKLSEWHPESAKIVEVSIAQAAKTLNFVKIVCLILDLIFN